MRVDKLKKWWSESFDSNKTKKETKKKLKKKLKNQKKQKNPSLVILVILVMSLFV